MIMIMQDDGDGLSVATVQLASLSFLDTHDSSGGCELGAGLISWFSSPPSKQQRARLQNAVFAWNIFCAAFQLGSS
jgi:hypothetical protein